MHDIRVFLTGAASSRNIGRAPPPAPGALPPAMPGGPGGIYLILNTVTNTRYAGISTNTRTRFTGRMAVINELGLSAANLTVVWAGWGSIRTRSINPPANFAAAFPTTFAGLPLANRYVTPGAGTPPTICPNALPNALPVAPVPSPLAAQGAVTEPIRVAVAAYQAWAASAVPRTAMTIGAAWPGAIAALPAGVAAVASVQPTAQAAANAAAGAAGAPVAVAAAAAAAVQAYAAAGVPAVSDVQAVVNSYYGGPALPAPPPWTVPIVRNPMGGGAGVATTLNHVLSGRRHGRSRARFYPVRPPASCRGSWGRVCRQWAQRLARSPGRVAPNPFVSPGTPAPVADSPHTTDRSCGGPITPSNNQAAPPIRGEAKGSGPPLSPPRYVPEKDLSMLIRSRSSLAREEIIESNPDMWRIEVRSPSYSNPGGGAVIHPRWHKVTWD